MNTAYAIRVSSNLPLHCAVSSAIIYDGFSLIDDHGSRFISEDVYRQYKSTHPQMKYVLEVNRNVVGRILERRKESIPVGYLLGKNVEPLEGELRRYSCTGFISCSIIAGKFSVSPFDKKFFDKENLSGHILGMFFANRTLCKSNLENSLISSLGSNKIMAIIKNDAMGGQRAYLNSNPAQGLGVLVL